MSSENSFVTKFFLEKTDSIPLQLVTLKVERLIKINEMPHEDMTRHDAIDSSFTFNVDFVIFSF